MTPTDPSERARAGARVDADAPLLRVSHLCQWHRHGGASGGAAGHPVEMLARSHATPVGASAESSESLAIELDWSGHERIRCSVTPLERRGDGALTVRIRLELGHASGEHERRCEELVTVLRPGARLPFMQVLLLQGMDQAVHSGVIEYG